MKIKLIVLTGVLIVVLLVGITGCTASNLQTLRGMVQNIDTVSGNVTVKLADGTSRTFDFTDVTKDTIARAFGSLSLEPGDNVTIREDNHHIIKGIKGQYAEVQGVIKAITGYTAPVASGNATITITADNTTDITLKVNAKTLVIIYATGRATIADLKAGQQVSVRYDITAMTAATIRVSNDGPAWQNRDVKNGKNREVKNIQNANGMKQSKGRYGNNGED
jgi:hypothetical protein